MDYFKGELLRKELQKQGERVSLLELTAKLGYSSPGCALKYIRKFVSDEKITCSYETEYDSWKGEKEEETRQRVKDEMRGVLAHRVVHNRFRS